MKEKFLAIFPAFVEQTKTFLVGVGAFILIYGALSLIKYKAEFPALGLFQDVLGTSILILGFYQAGKLILGKFKNEK